MEGRSVSRWGVIIQQNRLISRAPSVKDFFGFLESYKMLAPGSIFSYKLKSDQDSRDSGRVSFMRKR